MSALAPMIITDQAEWLQARREGIGASEAAAALGLSPFESPRELYLRKLGMIPEPDVNESMAEGLFMEPYIAQRYTERTGRAITATQLFYRSPTTPLMATIDGMTDAGYPVEFKWVTRDRGQLGQEDSDEIPAHWLIQAHQQMLLTSSARVDFAVKVAGQPLRLFVVNREEDLCDSIISGVRAFWERVKHRLPPPSNGRADARTLHLIYPDSLGEIDLTEEDAALLEDYEAFAAEAKDAEGDKAEAKAALLERLGNHAIGRLPDGRVITRKIINVAERTQTVKAYTYTGMWISKGGKN